MLFATRAAPSTNIQPILYSQTRPISAQEIGVTSQPKAHIGTATGLRGEVCQEQQGHDDDHQGGQGREAEEERRQHDDEQDVHRQRHAVDGITADAIEDATRLVDADPFRHRMNVNQATDLGPKPDQGESRTSRAYGVKRFVRPI